MLNTKYTYTGLESLHLEMRDEVNIVVHHIRDGVHAEREARALRDMINHDLPRIIRQVERETEAAVLAEIERIARSVHKEASTTGVRGHRVRRTPLPRRLRKRHG